MINKINNTDKNAVAFKVMNMSPLSNALYTLSNNDMLNASFVDIFAMDTPRTIVEFKHRGREAGIEMGFREYTGTFIAEFSAAIFALLTSKFFSKTYKPDVKVNSGLWATNKSLDTFNNIYKENPKTPEAFIQGALNSMSGIVGNKVKHFSEINKDKTADVQNKLVSIIKENHNKKETKKLLTNVQSDIIGLLGADNNITIKSKNSEFSANLTHTLRDMTRLGKNVFFNKDGINPELAVSKLKTLNKSRVEAAIPLSMLLAVTNQYINRKLTKKRTGIDNFVGENNYNQNVKNKNETKKEKGLFGKKLLSAGVFLLMLTKVMGIKKPSDFINKLEFDGPATGGNAIKTIYGTLILGRIFASKDSTELRETNTRDYLGFLNWLVLGGFVSKGVAQIIDPKQKELFNITKEGSGIGHWLKDVSLKSQKEIIAQGGNIKKNLRNLNIAQLSGIAYSAVMLGVLLPKLNIWLTKRNTGKKENSAPVTASKISFQAIKMDEFLKAAKSHTK